MFKKNNDFLISFAVFSSFVLLMMQYFILVAFNLLESPTGETIQVISKIIVCIIFLLSFKSVLKRSKNVLIYTYFFTFFMIFLSILFHPETLEDVRPLLFNILFVSLPSFIYISSIHDLKKLSVTIRIVSEIIFYLSLVFIIMYLLNSLTLNSYSMSIGYYLLLPLLVNWQHFLINIKFKSLIKSVILIIGILIIGSRGPVLVFVIFTIGQIIINLTNGNKKQIKSNMVIISLMLLLTFNLDKLFSLLNQYLFNKGFESRSLTLFSNDSINEIHLSGRESLYDKTMILISESPFVGYGISGEVQFIGTYSHNIVLEIMASMGIIMGTFVILSLLIFYIKAYIKLDSNEKNLYVLLFSLGIISLFVSGTYLTSVEFWVFNGFILNIYRFNQRRKDYEEKAI